jgi:hypothetical protein
MMGWIIIKIFMSVELVFFLLAIKFSRNPEATLKILLTLISLFVDTIYRNLYHHMMFRNSTILTKAFYGHLWDRWIGWCRYRCFLLVKFNPFLFRYQHISFPFRWFPSQLNFLMLNQIWLLFWLFLTI